MKKIIIAITMIFGMVVAFSSCTNNYSQGERVGIITKFSNKGLINKSWEGDLKIAPNIANGGMVGSYEDFLFSIDNDNTISCETSIDTINLYNKLGIPVVVTYQETFGKNWWSNRGDTDHFIRSVKRTK